MKPLQIAFDPELMQHDTGAGFAESPARLAAVERALQRGGLLARTPRTPAREITDDEIIRVHAPEHIARLEDACRRNDSFVDEQDVLICPRSFQLARLAAGYVVDTTRAVLRGEARRGFCGIRPPGHHAEHNRAMGFCLLNNVALAAAAARAEFDIERVLILDWDVHHGNGTQHLFERDPGVLFVSMHEHPDHQYPGTGYADECGHGPGLGFTLNIPMLPGSGGDLVEYAFREQILPRVETYRPQLILISAGFDAHADDPLGHLEWSDGVFTWMLERLLAVADQHTDGRLVSVLEGGYDLEALERCVAQHVARLEQ